ncbi:MAG: bifunctional riboflavin kinase/FMN adenylyltransferase [Anaerolineae bacterium CG03_land_8_20_14_0_80_58_20]|nr:MAG: bifunctional riboflavin kinase/FMN adenylyltransferase [Anaerolineae bacterium CG03_land_8_20_14_0_80_58_20]
MQHYRSLADVSLQNTWLTIGVFDGVHRGHQAILRQLAAGAHANGAPAVLLTFDPHPAVVLSGRDLKLLTTPDERADLASALGLEAVITHPFDRAVSGMSARDFMALLKKRLGLSRLLIGYDFALGKGREGNAGRLSELGRELGYSVSVVEAVSDESGVISSTEIRKLVSLGNAGAAANLLGRPYALSGPVIHGDGRGRRINIPTANIHYPESKLLPANGIYACRARLGADLFAAVVNIGFNPTFTPDKRTANVEAHILDFDRDLYGEQVTLEFIARLRDEAKFDSVDALLAQIHADIEKTRKILS